MDHELLAQLRAWCAAEPPESSAKAGKRSKRRHASPEHKTHQLCSQVHRVLDLALPTSADPVLQGCWVEAVSPSPNASRLSVTVATSDEVTLEDVQRRLERAASWLRVQVASGISRRKVPNLVMRVNLT